MSKSTWNAADLEQTLRTTGSYTEAAKHYGVTRQRVQVIAVKLLGAERCRELITGAHNKYEVCKGCHEVFSAESPHAAGGLCVSCYRPMYWRKRKQQAQSKAAAALETDWQALKNALGTTWIISSSVA